MPRGSPGHSHRRPDGPGRRPRARSGGDGTKSAPPAGTKSGAGSHAAFDPAGPLRRAVDHIGDRWMLLIVGSLLGGPRRFGELGDELGVAPNILTRRLRQLEADGVVVASPYSKRPVRLSYELTAGGRELAGALSLLADWGARRDGRTPDTFHDACGTPLELRPWCPTCDRLVDGAESSVTYDI